MKSFLITAEVTEEVCIAGVHGAGNEYISLDYIPGANWWGAMAGLTGIQPRELPEESFRRAFYSGDVIFSNLYPESRGDTTSGMRSHPAPLSARARKTAPGFPSDT